MTDQQPRITISITPPAEDLVQLVGELLGRPAAEDRDDIRFRHTCDATEQRRRAKRAEERAAEGEKLRLQFARYLMAAQAECGAPNWPALAEVVKALRIRAEEAEQERDQARATLRAVSLAVGQWRNGALGKYEALEQIETAITTPGDEEPDDEAAEDRP